MTQGRKAGMLPYGQGCKLYYDCLSCPLPDCMWVEGKNSKAQQQLIELEKPFLEKYLSVVGGKG